MASDVLQTTKMNTAADVVEMEIAGLKQLYKHLSDANSALSSAMREAVAACKSMKGRVIVTGMGKSGHIARKIASTLASTGVRASYVHPGEASHGDLGMISKDDIVMALSNSGETPELGDAIGYCARFGIPLIAMTSKAGSTLASASDILLLLPEAPEACAITKAPTTSTTMMIALGDALAVTVLNEKGFTADDFHTFHPGGKLGAALKRVTDLMHHKEMPLCQPNEAVSTVIEVISSKGFGCIGVQDNQGRLVGMVTDGDLRRSYTQSLDELSVADIMTQNPTTIEASGLAAEALAIFNKKRITALFIVDEDHKPIGLLHVHDCLATGVV
ncbi:MAG: KpsF/GutQ family sugar-phosphate isomerase [Pseudomonadota bacterium]